LKINDNFKTPIYIKDYQKANSKKVETIVNNEHQPNNKKIRINPSMNFPIESNIHNKIYINSLIKSEQ